MVFKTDKNASYAHTPLAWKWRKINMAGFQSPISIYQALKNIENKEYLLPAFQQEYVWSTEQIERPF